MAGNSGSRTQPVGQKQPNRLGLYDMSGNVQEWCSDWWVHSYYNQRVSNNPVGPAEGVNRVLRGGDYSYYAVICRVTSRYGDDPNRRFRRYGFRLAMDTAH
jgi:formylglycine-generating enzyme required for sulfatase activity